MHNESDLIDRCGNKCELCAATGELLAVSVAPDASMETHNSVMICSTCDSQIQNPECIDPNHWRCLNDSVWSEVPAVQVVAWRMLNRLHSEGWARDLVDTVYLPDEIREWAASENPDDKTHDPQTSDCNGTTLIKGDTVTLIKDLAVKGGGFTAKRGTTVKNIALTSNPNHVEGRVNGTQVVLVSAFLKKVT